ncbi:hypothetical protein ZWY2020_045480 [Hordeum vulgare]|uniref:Uncharacterized protein n=1 Tax=Hordeum vulgare subsp. vulgare TaxID=112509 RepID=A0A8I6WJD4_HORVV|nr:hypothetical protein ZWY2020_008441 [Hordeum vulgare]KAI5020592.1 hypothetical protein ZWY2020_045480 [Hordeum vulgare]
MGKYQGPKEPAGAPFDLPSDNVESAAPEEPEPVAKVVTSSSSEEEKGDRCNARRKRRQSVDADDMFENHGCSRNRAVGLKGHKAKVAEYMPKVQGEPKRKLWRSNDHCSDMYKYRGRSWPRVVGLDVNEAKRIIGEGKPELYFQVLPQYGLRTLGGSPLRVRLLVDKYNRIAETPHVG